MDFKGQRGVVTIEAALSMMVFIPALMTLMTIGMLTFTQTRVQYALNQSAKDVARYFYVVNRVGIYPKGPANIENKELDNVVDNMTLFYNALKDGGENVKEFGRMAEDGEYQEIYDTLTSEMTEGNYSVTKQTITNIQASGNNLYNSISSIDDPVAVIKTLGKTLGNEMAMHAAGAALGKALFSRYITGGEPKNVDSLLNNIGIKGGYDNNMQFWGSSLVLDGETINITVTYTITPPFSMKFFDEYKVTQVASTQAWRYEKQE